MVSTTYIGRFVMEHLVALAQSGPGEPWNKGKLVGQKAPLRLKEIWSIRIRRSSRSEPGNLRCLI
jgi:hypothetical protein